MWKVGISTFLVLIVNFQFLGEVDPIRDLDIISSELRFIFFNRHGFSNKYSRLKDLSYLAGALDKVEKLAIRAGDKTKRLEYDTLLKIKELLANKFVRQHTWDEKEVEVLNKHMFLTAKPIVYLVNLSEQDYIKKKNKWLSKIKAWIDTNDPEAVRLTEGENT